MARRSDVDEDVNEQRRKKYPPLYDLTQFTGKDAHAERSGALFGFIEYSRRHRVIFLVALIPSVFVTALLAPLLGSLAIFGFVITQAAAFFLMEARSRKGLKLRMYQTVYDRQTSVDGMLILCGQPIAPENLHAGWILFSNTLVDTPQAAHAPQEDDELATYDAIAGPHPASKPPSGGRAQEEAPLRGRRTRGAPAPEPLPVAELVSEETTLV